MPETICLCLYCDRVTGRYPSRESIHRTTVCRECQYKSVRNESWEVRAGLRPWSRPLSFWVAYANQTPLPDSEAAYWQQHWKEHQK